MKLATVLRLGLVLSALGYIAAVGVSLFPDRYWAFETLSNLRVQMAWAGALLTVALLIVRPRLVAFPVAALGALCAHLALAAAPAARQPVTQGGATLRVMTINIDFSHHDTDKLVAVIKAEQPDVLVMVEDFPQNRLAIANRVGGLPYHAETGIDLRAISIDSRLPLTDIRVESRDYVDHILTAKVGVPGPGGERHVFIIATHPFAPVRPFMAAGRLKALSAVADLAAASKLPVIVLGDLNTTAHSPLFAKLELTGHLIDTARGHSPKPTWISPIIPFGLRIDHVLVSPGIAAKARRVSPSFGGDHRAVTVDLVLPAEIVP